MNSQYDNRTTPPDPPSKRELDREAFEHHALNFVKQYKKLEDVFDTHEHDKKVSFPFAEYLSYHYVTVRTEEGYRHKKGEEWFTTNQVWDEYNTIK